MILLLSGAMLLTACDPTKRVPEGRYLLVKNQVGLDVKKVDRTEIEEIIKQKPNRKVLWLRLHLGMFNIPDPERIASKKPQRQAKQRARNEERIAKGKEAKAYRRSFWEGLREVMGEPPAILDSSATERSTRQIELYMQRKGYFNAQVKDTTLLKDKKAKVIYTIAGGRPYTLGSIATNVADARMDGYVQQASARSLLTPDERFDVDRLDAERTRISDHLKQLGYLYFSKDRIHARVDTTHGDHCADVTMSIPYPTGENADMRPFIVYSVKDVVIRTQRVEAPRSTVAPDTLMQRGYTFLSTGRPSIKPGSLLNAVFLKPNERFKKSDLDNTYRRLVGLRVFDRVDISFDTTGTRSTDQVNSLIRLIPAKQQNFNFEVYGTNRGGFLGTSVSFGYQHKNIFKGMENLSLKLHLGLEAQQSIAGTSTANADDASTNIAKDALFNTVEIGPELTLRLPWFLLPVKRERFARSAEPRTTVNTLYSFQRRPDFTRTLIKTSLGYEWKENRYKSWAVYPIEVNVVQIPQLSDAFRDYLISANDPVLTDSYTDHLILGERLTWTLNSQGTPGKKNIIFGRVSSELSGNLLGVPLSSLGPQRTDTNDVTFNTFGGVRYAQFAKIDTDLRYYYNIHQRSSVAFRVAGGVGVPYGNLGVLPFESSFFVGGANGLRAWRARSVGPGTYRGLLNTFDRIGEVKLEANIEYRFNLIGFLEGALFTDAGNIWLLQEDPGRPGSGISADLLGDLAVGTGIGFRLNFDYFLVRFDLGLQTKDPSLPAGERWLFQAKPSYESSVSLETGTDFRYAPVVNFNLGIGYPF